MAGVGGRSNRFATDRIIHSVTPVGTRSGHPQAAIGMTMQGETMPPDDTRGSNCGLRRLLTIIV